MACPRVIAAPRATGLPLVAVVDAPAAIARLYLDCALVAIIRLLLRISGLQTRTIPVGHDLPCSSDISSC